MAPAVVVTNSEPPPDLALSSTPPHAPGADFVHSATRKCSTPVSFTSSTDSPSASGPPGCKHSPLSLPQLQPENLLHSVSAPVTSYVLLQPPATITIPPPTRAPGQAISHSAHLHSASLWTSIQSC